MTERNRIIAVMFFEGGEKPCFMLELGKLYRSRGKHVNTCVQEVIYELCCTDIGRSMCVIPVAPNQLINRRL
jgi:hypothetical protein